MLKYKVRKKKSTFGKHKGKEVQVASVSNHNEVSFDDICSNINSACTATEADVKAVLSQLVYEIGKQLCSGHVVDCGDLGRFHLTGGSRQVPVGETFKREHLSKPRIKYTPHKTLKKQVSQVAYLEEK